MKKSKIARFLAAPRYVFLTDSLGAMLSAALLLVLAQWPAFVGMPRPVLYGLAGLACVFALYSMCGYFFAGRHWRPWLLGIAIANLAYACLTTGLCLFYFQRLSLPGLLYFSAEILVLGVVVYVERQCLLNPTLDND
ncbi:MAG: hypothetical protein IT260_07770 [Saprospiraceae bacterium]|nr:hypothetical protein [Saprospiraceae bacterium]